MERGLRWLETRNPAASESGRSQVREKPIQAVNMSNSATLYPRFPLNGRLRTVEDGTGLVLARIECAVDTANSHLSVLLDHI